MPAAENGSIFFPLIFHFHQPCGNFPWVIEEAYQKAYLPLIQTISEYPKIKANLHYSGSLLLWLQKNHPEYLEKLKFLFMRNQIEIIGGGFYEPILATIPEKDRQKQLQLMIDWWETNFSIKPRGAWLAERVWAPDLPRTFYDMNIKFTFIDDYLFRIAGYSEEKTFYAYNTEAEGKSIVVFPINEYIRYLIPWKDPLATIQYLKRGKDNNQEKIILLFSDAEKMGLWPAGDRTTHDICYINGYNGNQGWIPEFFELILANTWIKPVLISDYLEKNPPKGLIYLPTSSYDKMSVWALPTPLRKKLENLRQKAMDKEIALSEDILTFTTGSFWQNFLVKYSQSNIMHKRMITCRNKVELAEETLSHLPKESFSEIWRHIMAAQSNDAYWHGLFGGVYYPFLRHTVHQHLNHAEHLLDELYLKEGLKIEKCKIDDVLLDGQLDGVLENRNISCYVSSLVGGAIFSLNLKKSGYNFLNILTRRRESYHSAEMPSINDRFEKWMFQDHFLLPSLEIEAFQEDNYQDLGTFAGNRYKISQNSDREITLRRKGEVYLGENVIKTTIAKSYRLESKKLETTYDIDFKAPITTNSLIFSPEINTIIVSYPYKTRGIVEGNFFDLGKQLYHSGCQRIELRDENEQEQVCISFNFSKSIKCYSFPIFSIPRSESDWKKQYQGTSIFPMVDLSGKKLKFKIEVNLVTL
ncbi:MAG: alpha-amylase/4-alpha-glucanotransferase domain-containing protein [Candidatus Hermodarchaeota archaeon]